LILAMDMFGKFELVLGITAAIMAIISINVLDGVLDHRFFCGGIVSF
jgi:hypothetical protein